MLEKYVGVRCTTIVTGFQKFAAESAMLLRCQEQMARKDEQIDDLTQENEKLQVRL